jgi:HTH-type transcriptional regulator / antitoxin HigA
MSVIATKFSPPASYLRLVSKFPLRPIRTESEYNAAKAVMEKLAVRGEQCLDEGERDYLDGLDQFISAYDENVRTDLPRRRSPSQRLHSLVEDSGLTSRELQKILRCGHSLVSMLLSGKRELSKDNIRTLAKHFRLSADYFL